MACWRVGDSWGNCVTTLSSRVNDALVAASPASLPFPDDEHPAASKETAKNIVEKYFMLLVELFTKLVKNII
jgi:hypothetical protein